jgi:CRISPR-associated protein Cas1
MKQISSSELKTILHSKRANLYYLEHCRVLVKGGRVEYVTDDDRRSSYWNIPIANTTFILLGPGTSVTQAAMRELAKAGVSVGFCGGGGTPLFSATETVHQPAENDEGLILWFSPQSEYRPTEYLQAWVKMWFDGHKRLAAAKELQFRRLTRLTRFWGAALQQAGYPAALDKLDQAVLSSGHAMQSAQDVMALLAEEGRLTKTIFALTAQSVGYGEFTRAKRGTSEDRANQFLDHGNYLAYGLAATATWVLGLPHSLAVLHGKTRRGGLIFDVADLVKDSAILPQAFISAMRGDSEEDFRSVCIENLTQTEALDFMIGTLKAVATLYGASSSEDR